MLQQRLHGANAVHGAARAYPNQLHGRPGAVMRARNSRFALGAAAVSVALAISLLTPLIWTVWRPRWLPWPIESYIDGVHNLGVPQAWLFPIFPWTAFAFAGLAVGFVLLGDWARKRDAAVIARDRRGNQIGSYSTTHEALDPVAKAAGAP